jgi:hypothetical protein
MVKDFLGQRPHLIKAERVFVDNNGRDNRCSDNAIELQRRIGGVVCCGWLLFEEDDGMVVVSPHFTVLKDGVVFDSTPFDSSDPDYYLDLFPPTTLPVMPVMLVKAVGDTAWAAKRTLGTCPEDMTFRLVGTTKRLDNEAIGIFSFF